MTEELARDEAWHEARRIACANIARILARVNAGRRGKPNILELNLAEVRQMLETERAISRLPTIELPPVEETPEIDW